MNIGKEIETIIVEPVEVPIPAAEEPAPTAPEPVRS